MKHFLIVCILTTQISAIAMAQGSTDGYDIMSVKAGKWSGNLNTGRLVDSLTGNAHIVLKTEDGSKPDLPIKANTITFTWKEGQSVPSTIKMVGNVDIKHPDAKVKSERADWNLDSGDLEFTGDPVMDSVAFSGLRASKISINLNTGAYSIDQGAAENVALMNEESGGGAPIPGELAESDITDWAGLINAIKAQGKAEGDNPGKQVLKQLDEKTRGFLQSVDTPTLLSNKGDILKKLNGVLRRPGLFKRAAWPGGLSDEIEALLKISSQTPEQQVRQNRLLLQAAYPAMIKAL
jgi:lipopolysaccharide export system protein LptA